MRESSYGQDYSLGFFEFLGEYLSIRKISKILTKWTLPVKVIDLGSGFDARISCALNRRHPDNSYTAVDIQLTPNRMLGIRYVEGSLPGVLAIFNEEFDLVILNNVVEHLVEPSDILRKIRELLNSNSYLYINVPNWRAKFIFETLAWKFRLISGIEIEDHKNYFNRRDLWRLVVNSGYGAKSVKIFTHKFGLNTGCIIKISES